jgi:hypothetical protein
VSRRHLVATVVAALVTMAACEEHTVAIRFDPEVGDRYRFRSDIATEVVRTIDGETDVQRASSRLDATESVVEVDADAVEVQVSVERDGAAPRTYDVRFDRTGRLSTIDLVEGVPADALGLDLVTDLPADVASPPAGRIGPGTTWRIERSIERPGAQEAILVTGRGAIESLGVEDGHEVAVAVVDLRVPVRSVIDTDDGRITLVGAQASTSRTTYDLADGTARTDRTEIEGEVEVIVEPPEGIDAPPVAGWIRYDVRIDTRRLRTGPTVA